MAETNPYGQMTTEERLRFALWLQEAEKQNTKVLKDLVVELGLIHNRERNEGVRTWLISLLQKRSSIHIAMPFRSVRTHPLERNVRDKLTISGLSSALKAQKRSELTQKLGAIVDLHVETELRVGRESKDRRNLSISASSVDFYVGLP